MYREYFALEKRLKMMGFEFERSELLLSVTGKSSLKQLSHMEYRELMNYMRYMIGQSNDKKENAMRRKIIALFRKMGYEKNGKADMKAIYRWTIKYGKFHKALNGHSYSELVQLVSQVEEVYQSHIHEIDRV